MCTSYLLAHFYVREYRLTTRLGVGGGCAHSTEVKKVDPTVKNDE